MKRTALLCCVVLSILITGCSPSTEATGTKAMPATQESNSTKAPSSQEIVAAFKAAGIPIGKVEVYDESTDANKLLGRPNQYVAKTNWADARVEQPSDDVAGGTIETFSSASDLGAREEYTKSVSGSSPMFVQYQFKSGLMLMRLDRGLTPTQAKAYEAVFVRLAK